MAKRGVGSDEVRPAKKISQKEMQEMLIDNFVGLQQAMTNLSIKFEGLTEQMRRLLEVFELSAKNFAQQPVNANQPDNKELLDKIDSLLEQNKIIAKGIVMIEEKTRPKQPQNEYQESSFSESQPLKPKPLPRL